MSASKHRAPNSSSHSAAFRDGSKNSFPHRAMCRTLPGGGRNSRRTSLPEAGPLLLPRLPLPLLLDDCAWLPRKSSSKYNANAPRSFVAVQLPLLLPPLFSGVDDSGDDIEAGDSGTGGKVFDGEAGAGGRTSNGMLPGDEGLGVELSEWASSDELGSKEAAADARFNLRWRQGAGSSIRTGLAAARYSSCKCSTGIPLEPACTQDGKWCSTNSFKSC